MAPERVLDRPVKPWTDEEPNEEQQDHTEDTEDNQDSEDGSDSHSEDDEDEDHQDVGSVSESSQVDEASLQGISFGALAEAQESFTPNPKKRKLVDVEDTKTEALETYHPVYDAEGKREANKSKSRPLSRTSKHAPTVQSSRHAVSRKREIFDPSPALKSRDPRFDATVNASSADRSAADKANKNYSFLSTYQAAEILDLKAQIKKAKDPDVVAELKRQAMSIESKFRSAEARQRENEILKKHKQQEREAIKSGQKAKPYFLKPSDVRKEVLVEKFNSMGKKARDKAMDRKRKRTKGKESRGMPRARREREV